MTYGELKRRLRRSGVQLDEERTGHELWLNPANGNRTLIPRHNQREVPGWMLSSILRDLGLTREDIRP